MEPSNLSAKHVAPCRQVEPDLRRSDSPGGADPRCMDSRHEETLGLVALVLLFVSIWTVVKPYAGLVHDARLYAVQTAAKLHPDIFLGDLFLRYGSQDNFTIFPRLYAPLASAIGIESAAAMLTFVASLAWIGFGFLVARELSGPRLALMAVGILIATPGWYGAYEVFQIGEMFLSARLPAELFALVGLFAYLRRRFWLALAACAASALIHPLMAMPIIGLLMLTVVYKYAGLPIALAATFAAVASIPTVAFLLPTAPVEQLDAWVSVLETRSTFLFPSLWRAVDWQYHLLILATLLIASRTMPDTRIRELAVCAALVGSAGVLLAAIGASMPEHPALLRAQTWRWVWVACLLAILMLPQIVRDLWQRGVDTPARAAALLLASAWLLLSSVGGLLAIVALAILSQANRRNLSYSVSVNRLAWAALGLTLASIFVAAAQFAAYPLDTNKEPMWIQRLVNVVGPASSALVIVTACWIGVLPGRGPRPVMAVAAVAIAASVLMVPRAVRDWTAINYSGATYEAFAPWRSIIPRHAEVLWPGDAVATWLVLERRSYFSPDQLAGLLYSPDMTLELQRRASALKSFASPDWWTMADLRQEAKPKDLTTEILFQVCKAPGLDYMVSDTDLGFAASTVRRPGREIDLYLYDCRASVPGGSSP